MLWLYIGACEDVYRDFDIVASTCGSKVAAGKPFIFCLRKTYTAIATAIKTTKLAPTRRPTKRPILSADDGGDSGGDGGGGDGGGGDGGISACFT